MRRKTRFTTALVVGLVLVASSCSGADGSGAPSSPITAPPAASPDAGQALLDLISAPEAVETTATTFDRAQAESFVSELLTGYFKAVGARDWDAVYEASSVAFRATCGAERYADIVDSIDAEPTEIEFVGAFEVSIVGDFGTGSLNVYDQVGTFHVEGLLAVAETEGWRVAIDPCDAANDVADGDASYPLIIATTTLAPPPTEATIPPELTTTTTVPGVPGVPGVPTTTTIPGTPLTAADKTEIEAVLRDFMTAYAVQDWAAYHAAVPPLFECTPADTIAALAPFHFSPTAVSFSPMTITGADDEAAATFDVRYLDSLETVKVESLGAWEWGGVWYAAVHPCTSVDSIASNGSANTSAIDLLNDTLLLARVLYVGAGDYDIPTSALNEISETASFVEDVGEAGVGMVAYVDDDQEVLIVTQSGSGLWYCIAEDAAGGAHFATAFYLETVNTLAGCRSVVLAVPWSVY